MKQCPALANAMQDDRMSFKLSTMWNMPDQIAAFNIAVNVKFVAKYIVSN